MREWVGKIKPFEKLVVALYFINIGKTLCRGKEEEGPIIFPESSVHFARISLFKSESSVFNELV